MQAASTALTRNAAVLGPKAPGSQTVRSKTPVSETRGDVAHGASHKERGTRVVAARFAPGGSVGYEMAERGGRVTHHLAALTNARTSDASHSIRFAKLEQAASRGAPNTAHDWLRSIPASMKSAIAAPMVFAGSAKAATRAPQPVMERLAAFDPKPFQNSGSGSSTMQALGYAENVPLPSFQSAVDAETAVAVDAPQATLDVPVPAERVPDSEIAAVAMPIPQPQAQGLEGRQVASLEPRDLPSVEATATDAFAALVAPLPQDRPDFRPAPAPAPAPGREPAVAYARPNLPAATAAVRPSAPASNSSAPRNDGPSFFERLFGRGGSAQLPGAGSRIAVYEIKTATVYLPGDGRLEAHSGLGQMQDNPRYVTQKNRGPTPPNIYNLRLRESRFHGAEAIRLLPISGRKKYNRDGLLAHPYMYIGPGNDRSQSNGCVVFKDYPRFLKAFKKGRINQLIVVPSLDELPTYMARL